MQATCKGNTPPHLKSLLTTVECKVLSKMHKTQSVTTRAVDWPRTKIADSLNSAIVKFLNASLSSSCKILNTTFCHLNKDAMQQHFSNQINILGFFLVWQKYRNSTDTIGFLYIGFHTFEAKPKLLSTYLKPVPSVQSLFPLCPF